MPDLHARIQSPEIPPFAIQRNDLLQTLKSNANKRLIILMAAGGWGKSTLRAGYAYVQSPVPEETLNPSSPDADSHHFSAGSGYRIGRVVLDAFYMAAVFESIEVNNTILDGTCNTLAHYMGLGIGYQF